jgi:hypothetical protein
VFLADLTGELRAWPHDTWTKLGVDPDQVAQAVVGCWQAGQVTGLQVDDLGFEEARSLAHPAGDDLCPRPAPRPPHRPAGSRPLALAAPHQRPPPRRPIPGATAPPPGGQRTRQSVRGARNLGGITDGHSGTSSQGRQ